MRQEACHHCQHGTGWQTDNGAQGLPLATCHPRLTLRAESWESEIPRGWVSGDVPGIIKPLVRLSLPDPLRGPGVKSPPHTGPQCYPQQLTQPHPQCSGKDLEVPKSPSPLLAEQRRHGNQAGERRRFRISGRAKLRSEQSGGLEGIKRSPRSVGSSPEMRVGTVEGARSRARDPY